MDAPKDWRDRLDVAVSLVAEQNGNICGFMTLHADGFLDFAYVLPNRMGTGLSGDLYTRLESGARDKGMDILSTEASHLFQQFLLKRGWQVDAAQHVIRDGVAIPNFRMTKRL